MSDLRGACPAKLNLALAVTGRRDDGYHTLHSVFVRISLHDELEVERAAEPGGADLLVVRGDDAVPLDENLILQAAHAVRASAGEATTPALRFSLTKRIPVAAGLGGGSSDAATAMHLASSAWGLPWRPVQQLKDALRLGADVPFFVAGHAAALVDGIGEGLRPLPPPTTPAGLVLVTPARRLSTAAVFDEFDAQPARSGALASVDRVAAALGSGIDGARFADLMAALDETNELWPAATRLSPDIVLARTALAGRLGRPVLLTGSGPTLFAVYPSEEAAAQAGSDLERDFPAFLAGAAITIATTIEGDHT